MTRLEGPATSCSDTCCAHLAVLRPTDLLIAAAHLDVHGKPHLRGVADRLEALAASLPPAQGESTPEPTPSVTEPTGGTQ